MCLNKEHQIEIILKVEAGSSCMVAIGVNRNHEMNITLSQNLQSLKNTRSVTDQPRCDQKCTASDEGTRAMMLSLYL